MEGYDFSTKSEIKGHHWESKINTNLIIFFDSPVRAPYMRSFNLHDLTIGTHKLSSNSLITIQAVSIARESQLV